MRIENLSTLQTVTITRQVEQYAAAGGDGKFVIPLPFAINWEYIFNNPERTSADILVNDCGLDMLGFAKQMDQVFKENVGNLLNSKIKLRASKGQDLPTQEVLDNIVAAYDFSGSRTSSSESDMTEEERVEYTAVKKLVKDLLAAGSFTDENQTRIRMKIQTGKEAKEDILPDGKVSIDTLETVVRACLTGEKFVVPEISETEEYAPGAEAIYDDNTPTNLPAFIEQTRAIARTSLEREKAIRAAIGR